MKKKVFLIVIIILVIATIFIPIDSVWAADENETIKQQQGEFKIQDFIKNSKEYTGEFFEDIDINEILNGAIQGKVDNNTLLKKILNLLGKEVVENVRVIVSILVIIVIHSILKSISESLENDGIAKLIYYVQYILIVTIIMANF